MGSACSCGSATPVDDPAKATEASKPEESSPEDKQVAQEEVG